MVSVGVAKLGYTSLIFVDPGVKVNEASYHDMLLSPTVAACHMSGLWQVLNCSARQCLSTQGVRNDQPPSAQDSCIRPARFVVA